MERNSTWDLINVYKFSCQKCILNKIKIKNPFVFARQMIKYLLKKNLMPQCLLHKRKRKEKETHILILCKKKTSTIFYFFKS